MRFAGLQYPMVPLAACAAVLLSACASSGVNLRPAPEAEAVQGIDEAARTEAEGVTLRALPREWPGDAPIDQQVTPVQVRMENDSGRPLALRYQEVVLEGPQGQEFRALPPFQLEGEVDDPAMVKMFDPVPAPAFTWSGFHTAPFYGDVFTRPTPFGNPFPHDPHYYQSAYAYWTDYDPPTSDMLARALPEGVVDDGGFVQGWLYFERVPEQLERVTLRAELVDAEADNASVQLAIPFVVEAP